MFFSVLPGRRSLNFPYCGVKVELSFSALFSNVLVVFGTVSNTNAKAQDCTLILESEPVSQCFMSSFAVINTDTHRYTRGI